MHPGAAQQRLWKVLMDTTLKRNITANQPYLGRLKVIASTKGGRLHVLERASPEKTPRGRPFLGHGPSTRAVAPRVAFSNALELSNNIGSESAKIPCTNSLIYCALMLRHDIFEVLALYFIMRPRCRKRFITLQSKHKNKVNKNEIKQSAIQSNNS